jgi:predicted tellurium resistance membrane protein TerC
MPFGQTFEPHDLIIIAVLVVLEGVLSLDNALVLGLLARRLPKHLRARALTYGLVGAFVFRVMAIALAGFLLKWELPKLLGGAYLLWVAGKYFFFERTDVRGDEKMTVGPDGLPQLASATGQPVSDARAEHEIKQLAPAAVAAAAHSSRLDYQHATSTHTMAFWMTVGVIELTDIAFAVDSILAAVGTVPGREKLWIVVTGGMLGVILMRFAAVVFVKLLDRFPRFETAAYLLVAVIGLKLVLDYFTWLNFHDPRGAAFWAFWIAMIAAFCFGFIPHSRSSTPAADPSSTSSEASKG